MTATQTALRNDIQSGEPMNATLTARTQSRRTLRNQRGMSLVETVVALGLFALTAAAMGDFLVSQAQQSSSSYLDTVAYDLAVYSLESMRGLHYADMAADSRTVDEGGVTFTVSTDVQPDTPSSGLKTVNAQVSWNEPSGPKSVSVATIYTEIAPL